VAHASTRVTLDMAVARRFVDMPLHWYHRGVRVDWAAVAAALAAVDSGTEPEALVSHHQLGGRAGPEWHALRIAYFIRRPERIRGVRLHIGPPGVTRIDDGRHRYGAALYLGLRQIPNCWVSGSGAPRYHAQAGTAGAGPEEARPEPQARRVTRHTPHAWDKAAPDA